MVTNYKDELVRAMTCVGADPKVVFIGYNVRCGSKANGTLVNVNEHQLIETPVAENLMAGLGVGMALAGFKPVIYFERFDFILNALDAIVNHLDKVKQLSKAEFNPTAILRCVVGGTKQPLFTGPTHTQNYSEALRQLVSFPVIELIDKTMIEREYKLALDRLADTSTCLVEFRDAYSQ